MVPVVVVLMVALMLGRAAHREGRRGCVIGVDRGVCVAPAPRRDHGDSLHVGRCGVKEFGAARDGARAIAAGRRINPLAVAETNDTPGGRVSITSTMP